METGVAAPALYVAIGERFHPIGVLTSIGTWGEILA